MVEQSIDYEGALRCVAVHGPSGDRVVTDAPADNEGRGEAFSPTDLVATALGTCIATTMAIVAKRNGGAELAGMSVAVTKEMTSGAPRRIARLGVVVRVPLPGGHEARELLERSGRGCPVARSLAEGVEVDVRFEWVG